MKKRNLKPRTEDAVAADAFRDEEDGSADSLEEFFGDAANPPPPEAPAPKVKAKGIKASKPVAHKRGLLITGATSATTGQEFDFASLDPQRKLSKKAKASLDEWKGDDRTRKRDGYFRTLAEAAKQKFGHRAVLAGNEANTLLVGIPMPSIALEWLFLSDALLLSLIYIFAGKWGTGKSGLLYEVYRWFVQCNGGAIHNDVELKFSPDLCQSVMNYADDQCPIVVNRCYHMEDWQEKLTYWMDLMKNKLVGTKEEPGPGRTIPVAFGIDSVMARSTLAKQEKIAEEGSAGKGYPDEAQSITAYLRGRSQELENWPFALFLINHLKQDLNRDTGVATMRTPGGEFANFQESFEIHTSLWASKIETDDFNGLGVRLSTAKNSMAEGKREIFTRMLWWDEPVGTNPVTGQTVYRQRTIWDWEWSTIHTLTHLPGKYSRRLKDLGFEIKTRSPKGHVECAANCTALGMGKEDYLPFREVGDMIAKDQKTLELLRTALGIKRRPIMQGDFAEQLERLEKKLV